MGKNEDVIIELKDTVSGKRLFSLIISSGHISDSCYITWL